MSEIGEKLKKHIIESIYKADRNISNIRSDRIHTVMPGLTSSRIRHLLNNICSLENTVYLDLGTYRGSSVVSAVWENDTIRAYAVDKFNFNPYEPKPYNKDGIWNSVLQDLKNKLTLYKLENKVKVIVSDTQKLSKKEILKKANVVFYDASFSLNVVEKTIDSLSTLLAPYCIFIVSNTQNKEIVDSFDKSFVNSGFKVYWNTELRSRVIEDKNTWWNGIKIYILQSPKSFQEIKEELNKKEK